MMHADYTKKTQLSHEGKGTTWRSLPDGMKENIADAKSAKKLMLEKPSVIKRPVLELGDEVHIGFSPSSYQRLFV